MAITIRNERAIGVSRQSFLSFDFRYETSNLLRLMHVCMHMHHPHPWRLAKSQSISALGNHPRIYVTKNAGTPSGEYFPFRSSQAALCQRCHHYAVKRPSTFPRKRAPFPRSVMGPSNGRKLHARNLIWRKFVKVTWRVEASLPN
jgi:hypothetical protein